MECNPEESSDLPTDVTEPDQMDVDNAVANTTNTEVPSKSEVTDDIAPEEVSEHLNQLKESESTSLNQNTMDVDQVSPSIMFTSIKQEVDDNNDAADALSTLASAALGQDQALKNELKESKSAAPQPVAPLKMESSPWCDVGIIKGTSCVIKHFFHTNHTNEYTNINSDELPDYTNCQKVELLPGTAYKFRVCAINAYGKGEWSDVSAFKTCLPGFPGAPSSIKISKSAEGAHLSWEPPPANSGKIIEYSVCLAVRNATIQSQGDSKTITSVPGQLAFVRVYCGPQNQAVVYNSSLAAAHIDTTAKPAIIFRIAAKNDKGYGPATQVRWLQDSPSSSSKSTPSRRDKSQQNTSSSKKYKTMNSY